VCTAALGYTTLPVPTRAILMKTLSGGILRVLSALSELDDTAVETNDDEMTNSFPFLIAAD
jgi:hypothetical protein